MCFKFYFKRFSKINYLISFLLTLMLSSCSLLNFSDQFDELTQDGQFTQTASSTRNPTSTQADIAAEFNSLVTQRGFSAPSLESTQYSDYDQQPIYLSPEARARMMNYYRYNRVPANTADFSIHNKNFGHIKSNLTKKYIHNNSTAKLTQHSYVIKPGDTLMKISFEKYGDILKWRDILAENSDRISNPNQLVVGTELKVSGETYVVVEKNGQPYLIKKGDTLVKISSMVYGQSNYWSSIWKNNSALIKDPNKIYAGFTLYYMSLEQLKNPVQDSQKLGLSKLEVEEAGQKSSSLSDISNERNPSSESKSDVQEKRPAYPNSSF